MVDVFQLSGFSESNSGTILPNLSHSSGNLQLSSAWERIYGGCFIVSVLQFLDLFAGFFVGQFFFIRPLSVVSQLFSHFRRILEEKWIDLENP